MKQTYHDISKNLKKKNARTSTRPYIAYPQETKSSVNNAKSEMDHIHMQKVKDTALRSQISHFTLHKIS
ncbi:MAG: hypothetical protein DRJ38_04055 [Thermoprotei archaeon]|nr:MAG: hypothetical protein DRJ38_04055 [Thermoprotei archaeon]